MSFKLDHQKCFSASKIKQNQKCTSSPIQPTVQKKKLHHSSSKNFVSRQDSNPAKRESKLKSNSCQTQAVEPVTDLPTSKIPCNRISRKFDQHIKMIRQKSFESSLADERTGINTVNVSLPNLEEYPSDNHYSMIFDIC